MESIKLNCLIESLSKPYIMAFCVILSFFVLSLAVQRFWRGRVKKQAPFGRRRTIALMGKLLLCCFIVSWKAAPANAQWTDFAAMGQRIQAMITQLLQYIGQIEQKLAAFEQLANQIKQLEMLTRQLVSLPKNLVQGTIGQVMQFYNLFKEIQGLGDEIKSLGREFDNFYPTYGAGSGSIRGALESVKSFSRNLDSWMGKTREASKNVLKTAGIIEESNKLDMDTAAQYVEQALYADGQMQVQQAQTGLTQVQIKQAAEAKLQMQALSDVIATEAMERQSKEAARQAYLDDFWKVK